MPTVPSSGLAFCEPPPVEEDVIVTPNAEFYPEGYNVVLSCADHGKVLSPSEPSKRCIGDNAWDTQFHVTCQCKDIFVT